MKGHSADETQSSDQKTPTRKKSKWQIVIHFVTFEITPRQTECDKCFCSTLLGRMGSWALEGAAELRPRFRAENPSSAAIAARDFYLSRQHSSANNGFHPLLIPRYVSRIGQLSKEWTADPLVRRKFCLKAGNMDRT